MSTAEQTTSCSAVLSDDGHYRYRLARTWDPDVAPATFVMLNPSTADATADDPTIRRCMTFARSWGCGGLVVVNLYALRSTDPRALRWHDDPVGPDNDDHLADVLGAAADAGAPVIAAWGAHGEAGRVANVALIAEACGAQFHALKVTKSGAPGHPLYIRADAERTPWAVGRIPDADERTSR